MEARYVEIFRQQITSDTLDDKGLLLVVIPASIE